MSGINIREVRSDELAVYQQFLGKGLVRDEESFRITPGDDADAPFPTKDRVDSFTLGAYVGDELAGVVSFERDGANREKLKHKGILFRMYVSGDHRGHGIAKMLINELVERVKQIGDIEQVNLTVVADNKNAKMLYERLGFTTFATERNAIKWKGKYFTENQMALCLV